MKLRWSPTALDDLREIGHYIARDKPRAARRWVQRLRQRARLAALQPRAGRVVPEYRRDEVREVFERSYRIIYEITANEVVVLAVREGHQLVR